MKITLEAEVVRNVQPMWAFPGRLMTMRSSIVGLWFLGGCASQFDLAPDDADLESSDTDVEDTADVDTPDDDADGVTLGAQLAVDGVLAITGGAVDVGASSLTLRYYDGSTLVCERTATVDASEGIVSPDPDVAAAAWWRLSLSGQEGDGCASQVPASVDLGFAAPDPRLEAATASAGFEPGAASALYSVLLHPQDTDVVWIFGVAGTVDQMDGLADPVDGDAVTDGVYEVTTVYLVPWTP